MKILSGAGTTHHHVSCIYLCRLLHEGSYEFYITSHIFFTIVSMEFVYGLCCIIYYYNRRDIILSLFEKSRTSNHNDNIYSTYYKKIRAIKLEQKYWLNFNANKPTWQYSITRIENRIVRTNQIKKISNILAKRG